MRGVLRSIYGALWVTLLLCAACGDPQPLINVAVSGRDAAVVSLELAPTLEGKVVVGGAVRLREQLDRFQLRLPAGARGAFVLGVSGQGADGCQRVVGQGSLSITSSDPVELSIALREERGCRLTLRRVGAGAGRVVLAPPPPGGRPAIWRRRPPARSTTPRARW